MTSAGEADRKPGGCTDRCSRFFLFWKTFFVMLTSKKIQTLDRIGRGNYNISAVRKNGRIYFISTLLFRKEAYIKMAEKQVLLTADGLRAFEEELEYLKSVKRKDIADKIKVALSFGDLSENSEYDEAKNEQAQVESRIAQIEAMLKNVKIIDESEITTEVVSVGTKVTVFDADFDEEEVYQIVGSTEANPDKGLISDESPVGKALIGASIGDTVEVETPGGITRFKVLHISK